MQKIPDKTTEHILEEYRKTRTTCATTGNPINKIALGLKDQALDIICCHHLTEEDTCGANNQEACHYQNKDVILAPVQDGFSFFKDLLLALKSDTDIKKAKSLITEQIKKSLQSGKEAPIRLNLIQLEKDQREKAFILNQLRKN